MSLYVKLANGTLLLQNGFYMMIYDVSAATPSEMPQSLIDKFTFLWRGPFDASGNLQNELNSNVITVTNKDFTTTIPYDSSATFSMPNVSTYKTADAFDEYWYDASSASRSITVTNLIEVDPTKTLVKYARTSPYAVEWIGLLDVSASISESEWNSLFTYFDLHVFWNGGFNSYGSLKDNRPLNGQGYKGWITAVNSLGLTNPSDNVKLALNTLNVDLLLGGIHSGFDKFWVFMLNDASLVTGAATISFANSDTSIRVTYPVPPTYTTAGFYGNATDQYANTHYSPYFNGVNYTLNSASRIVYRHNGTGAGALDGGEGGWWNAFAMEDGYLNRIHGPTSIYGGPGSEAFIAINRSSVSNAQYYRNNMVDYTTDSSTILVPGQAGEGAFLLRHGWGYGDSEISMYAIGRSFNETEMARIRSAFNRYVTRLGL